MEAITYKEISKLIKENKVWLGINSNRNFSGFIVPKHYSLYGTEARIDENGNRIVSTNSTCWFTNLDIQKRHEDLILYKSYNPEEYPKFDYYDAININVTKDIPCDYDGAMGVPITFIDKYNPDQFVIIDANDIRINGVVPTKEHGLIKDKEAAINGKPTYVRIVIKNKNPQIR